MKSAVALQLLENVRSFIAVEFSEEEAEMAIGSLNFVMGISSSKGKKPNCTPGKSWSCGYTCLPMSKKNCGSTLDGKPATFAEKLAGWIAKIPGLKGVAAKIGGQKATPAKVTTPEPALPPKPKKLDPIGDEMEAIATGKRDLKVEESDRQDFRQKIDKSAPNSFDDYAEEVKGKIPPPKLEEAVALRVYTSDEYSRMNSALRKGNHEDQSESDRQYIESNIKLATAGLEQMPSYKGTTYRAAELPLEVIQKYKPGESIVERGFTSTAASKAGLEGFDVYANVRYVIDSTKGKDVSKLSEHPGEQEVLYPPGSRFKVLNVEEKNGVHTIYMRDDDD